MPSKSVEIKLPEAFRECYTEAFGQEELALLERALAKPISSSLRVNPLKEFSPHLRPVPWCKEGYYTDKDVTFGADPIWHAGGYYVQEPASMFVAQYFQQYALKPHRALDLCAAPGGKSTLLRSYLPSSSTLIANDPDNSRAKVLCENFTRWGADETIIISGEPKSLSTSGLRFDLILVDAPCSGEGMFRKEPQAITEWSKANVESCASRQKDILNVAWEMLEDDGIMIYSTCTFNKWENEHILEFLLDRDEAIELLPLTLNPKWGVRSLRDGVYRFAPHHTESEGLTIFALRKTGMGFSNNWNGKKKLETNIPPFLNEVFHDELHNLYAHDGRWYYLSPFGQQQLATLKKVKILSGGVLLGEQKGKDFIPDIAWIFSPLLSSKLPYPRFELHTEDALKYLMRENIMIEGEKGIHIVTYHGIPLGAVKHLGNRTNNLYPKEFAIRNKNLQPIDTPTWE